MDTRNRMCSSVKHDIILQVVFIGMCIMAPVWGLMGDKYGRQTVCIHIHELKKYSDVMDT